MSRDELNELCFTIIASAGEARSYLIRALNAAKHDEFEEAEEHIKKAHDLLISAHHHQTNLIVSEAKGECSEIGFIAIHAQDHLMTTLLLQETIINFIHLYERTSTK